VTGVASAVRRQPILLGGRFACRANSQYCPPQLLTFGFLVRCGGAAQPGFLSNSGGPSNAIDLGAGIIDGSVHHGAAEHIMEELFALNPARLASNCPACRRHANNIRQLEKRELCFRGKRAADRN
jgi:hypothetical protein